ncbi:alpha/beta fold hydrolase [Streptomyces sp. NPDC059649]|uniref:alpha/beta fold hydrolase n=1 Tax=Streptomyces sp. NPDC059649 TaxID=3346895 RepID=UPI0036C4DF01
MSTPSSHVASTGDGAEIYYESHGVGQAILSIGGVGAGVSTFSTIAPLISEEFKFITYDRRGTYRSTGARDRSLKMAEQSTDIIAVQRAAGVSSSVIFASCGGASIAFDLVSRFPSSVDALVVHEPLTLSVLPDAAEQIAFFRRLRETNSEEGPVPAMRMFMERHDLEITPAFRALTERSGDSSFRNEVMPMAEFVPDYEAIRASGVPLMMAVGEVSRAGGYGFARTVPLLAEKFSCETAIFPGGHIFHDQPEPFSAALRAAVRKALEGQESKCGAVGYYSGQKSWAEPAGPRTTASRTTTPFISTASASLGR